MELSELDKYRSSHSVDSVGEFVELTIFNACSGVNGSVFWCWCCWSSRFEV